MQAFVCNNEGVPVADTMLTLQISNQQAKPGVSRGCLSPVELGKRLLLYSKDGDTEEVKNLISRGAPFTTDWLGVSPLHLAAQMGHTETAEVLLRGGISRDARTKVDRTPLHIAAQEGHTGIVALLLEHGADVDSEDMLRMTPLHWAVERGHMDTVIKLLENGANPNAVSKFDKTPILIAIDQNRVDLLDVLQNNAVYAMSKEQEGEHFLSQLDEADSAAEHLAVELASSQSIIHQEEEVSTSHGIHVYEPKGHSMKINYLNSSEKVKPRKAVSSGVGTSNAQSNIQLLRAHGITMLPADDSNLVASAMESGQTVVLTEAGKLALNLTRNASGNKNVSVSPSKIQQRKVVTISAEQLAALTGKITKVIPVHKKQSVAPTTMQKTAESKDANTSRVITTTTGKRVFPSSGTSTDNVKLPELVLVPESDIVKETSEQSEESTSKDEDLESMAKKLAQAKKEAEQYRQQLLKKEQEAEEYMKKLQSLSK